MRDLLRPLLLLAALCAAALLAACGQKGLERIDVTWNTDPPPRWGLYPGYRQEIPCPKGATYQVDLYRKDKPFTGGTVADLGYGLGFKPGAGAHDLEAVSEGRDHLTISVTLRDEKGQSSKQVALRVERKGDKIYFEFPKD